MQDDDVRLPEQDRLRLRLFTLADHAATPPDGKIYIGGAGVHNLNQVNIPGPIMAPLFVVVRLHFPYLEAGDPHRVRIRILDEEMQPIGQDPVIDVANIETGRPPGIRPGDENPINVVLGLTGYPIQREGRARVYLEVDGQPMDSLPLRIARIQPTAILPQPG
jgi:hypothetical protein